MPDDVGSEGLAGWQEALSESWSKAGSAPETETPAAPAETAPEPAAEAAPEPSDDRPRGPDGKFLKKDAGAAVRGDSPARQTSPGAQDGAAPGAQASPPPGSVAPAAPPAPVPDKAPQSWNALERDSWLKGDVEGIRKAALRREQEIQRALQETAERTKNSGEWGEVVRPYEAQIRQLGVQPAQYVGDLLKTAHALTYSHPQQKADVLAGLIMQFNIPPADLDAALVARMQGRPATAPQAPQQDPRVDQLLHELNAQKASEAEARITRFAESHDYMDDVAEEMTAIIEGWKKIGRPYNSDDALERAYRMACSGNEVVSKAIEQKKATETAANVNASTQRAKAASISVRSQPGGPQAPPSPGDDIRSHMSAAWDRLAGQ